MCGMLNPTHSLVHPNSLHVKSHGITVHLRVKVCAHAEASLMTPMSDTGHFMSP